MFCKEIFQFCLFFVKVFQNSVQMF